MTGSVTAICIGAFPPTFAVTRSERIFKKYKINTHEDSLYPQFMYQSL